MSARSSRARRRRFTVDAFPGRDLPGDDHARRSRLEPDGRARRRARPPRPARARGRWCPMPRPDGRQPDLPAAAGHDRDRRDRHLRASTNVLLVPNAALRFTPQRRAASSGRAASPARSTCRPPARQRRRAQRRRSSAARRRRSMSWARTASRRPVQVTTGDTNGTMTEVIARRSQARHEGDHRPARAATAAAASGGSGQRRRQRRQGGGQRVAMTRRSSSCAASPRPTARARPRSRR